MSASIKRGPSGALAPLEQEPAPVLSVVIPVYNEVGTIGPVVVQVTRALPGVPKQIIVVDDGSSDGTAAWLRRNLAQAKGVLRSADIEADGELRLSADGMHNAAGFEFTLCVHDRNRGKGAAVRTGLACVAGDLVVIQDADLEYDPDDWSRMLPLITDRKVADVVYGSRFYGRPHRSLYYHHYIGNRIISILFNILYNQMLTDIEVCYKMFTREVLQELALTAEGFGFEIEISAQIARAALAHLRGRDQLFFGRTYEEGKKINWRDGVKALFYLAKFRTQPIRRSAQALQS